MRERLQKLIARAGVASRRHAEQLILTGAVAVNGEIVTELGSKADPDADHIKVNGRLLRFPERKLYLILHKPANCVSTMSDPEGRPSLREYVRGLSGRVYPVGRLDYHTEGLLVLTNDGDFAHRVMKISRRLWQTFWLKTKGALSDAQVRDAEQFVRARLVPLPGRGSAENPWYQVTLTEARSDLLRPFLARMGHPVEKFRRVKFGNLDLGSLAPGESRDIDPRELRELMRAVDQVLGGRDLPRPEEPRRGSRQGRARRGRLAAETRRGQQTRRARKDHSR